MAYKTLVIQNYNTGIAQGISLTRYHLIGTGLHAAYTTEPEVNRTFRTAGVFSNLFIRVIASNTINTTTYQFRKNTANGNQIISILAGTTGEFEDVANTDAISIDDEACLSVVTGAGTSEIIRYTLRSLLFLANSSSVSFLLGQTLMSFATDSVTRYSVIIGYGAALGQTVEGNVQHTARNTGTVTAFSGYIQTNARITTSTVGLRKNTANGNSVLSIGAGLTGWFQDITNTDTVAIGDFLNYYATTSTGGGALYFKHSVLEFVNSDAFQTIAGGQNLQGVAYTSSSVSTSDITGYVAVGIDEANESARIDYASTQSNFHINLQVNGVTSTSTWRVRKNLANGNQVISIPASTTGKFEDVTNTDSFSAGDDLCTQLTAGAGGTQITPGPISIKASALFVADPSAGGISSAVKMRRISIFNKINL